MEVEKSLGLIGISTSPRRLIVIGRSAALTDENRRAITTIQNAHNKLRILTYDDLLASARSNLERILGPLSIVGQNNTQVLFFKPQSVNQNIPSST
jgi:predicted nucleic acid-binding OB-fold protein